MWEGREFCIACLYKQYKGITEVGGGRDTPEGAAVGCARVGSSSGGCCGGGNSGCGCSECLFFGKEGKGEKERKREGEKAHRAKRRGEREKAADGEKERSTRYSFVAVRPLSVGRAVGEGDEG